MSGTKVDVMIESLEIGTSSPFANSSRPETATVAFGGSSDNMQIVSSKLCSATGRPVIESKPSSSKNDLKILWSGQRHLTLACHNVKRFNNKITSFEAWSGKLPDIVELTVRYRGQVGIGFLVVRRLDRSQIIPLHSDDWENAKLKVRATLVRDEYVDDEESPPSVAECSTGSSSNLSSSSFAHYASNIKDLLRGHPVLANQHQGDGGGMVPPQAAAPPGTCSFFNWEHLRLAIAACHPVTQDDLSTIATRESWGEF